MQLKDNILMEPMEQLDQPDADYIKMFVGQVPRDMDEQKLREMFEEYGRVHTINVLRDKSNGMSKGEKMIFNFLRHFIHSIKLQQNTEYDYYFSFHYILSIVCYES